MHVNGTVTKIGKYFRTVVLKVRYVRHEDILETNNPNICFRVLDGDKAMKDVDRSGNNVHHVTLQVLREKKVPRIYHFCRSLKDRYKSTSKSFKTARES